jgi:DNA-binding response OmpR family regulator
LYRLQILFVDSDPRTQTKIQQLLGEQFSVQCVESIADAMQCLQKMPIDMVIAEVTLNQESGLDLCRMIRHSQTLHYMPIMLLTSLSTLQDKVAGFAVGADDYVIKPFDVSYLQARIRLLARIKRIQQKDEGVGRRKI